MKDLVETNSEIIIYNTDDGNADVKLYSKDGVIEAIEMIGNPKVMGVQFHPEGFVSAGDDTFIGLFKQLLE